MADVIECGGPGRNPTLNHGETMAVAMWDFSWLERRFPGGGYEDWDRALSELVERGYNAVRIDAYPHLIAADEEREWELVPIWTAYPWGAQGPCRVKPKRPLLQFLEACQYHGIRVLLSTWFCEDETGVRDKLGSPERHAEVWLHTLRLIRRGGLESLIALVDFCNEWPGWAGFFQRTTQGAVDDWTTMDSQFWMERVCMLVRAEFPAIPLTFSFSERHAEWRGVDVSCLDALELHWWMAQHTRFYKEIGHRFAFHGTAEFDLIARSAEPAYRSNEEWWKRTVDNAIQQMAEWSRAVGRPLITSEGWAIVNYADYPELDWGWVKELNAYAVETACSTKAWGGLCTSNFCGPQFTGMWSDVKWHQELTTKIRKSNSPMMPSAYSSGPQIDE